MDDDWTKRRQIGLGLVVTALSGVVALLSSATIGYLFSGALLLAGITILVRDWRTTKTLPKETKLSTEFTVEDLRKTLRPFPIYTKENRGTREVPWIAGFLLVHNTGASTVRCRAMISVNDGIRDWPLQPALAYWYNCRSSYIDIESGGTRKIIVAILQMSSLSYRWAVPYWLDEKPRNSYTEKSFRGEKTSTSKHAHISIIIKSDPFPGNELPKRSFILEGQGIKTV